MHLWIDEVLLGLGRAPRAFRGSGFTDINIWNELAIGIDGYYKPGRLVLANEGVNLKKSKLFEGESPTVANHARGVTATRKSHRNVSALPLCLVLTYFGG